MMATSWLAPDSWRQNQDEAIREAFATGPDWTEYLALVDRHRTPALSWAALNRLPGITVAGICQAGITEAQRCLPHEGDAALSAFGRRAEAVQPRRHPRDAAQGPDPLLCALRRCGYARNAGYGSGSPARRSCQSARLPGEQGLASGRDIFPHEFPAMGQLPAQ